MIHPFVKSAFKQFVREFLSYHLIKYHPGTSKPIFLYASRRGGSTLLAQVLSVIDPTLLIDQPFSVFTTPSYYFRGFVGRNYGPITSEVGIEQALSEYIAGLSSGGLRPGVTINPFQTGFHLRPSQIVVKVTDAQALAPWIAANSDVMNVMLCRHPIAQARSVFRAGWGPIGAGFIRDPVYSERYLTSTQRKFAEQIYSSPLSLDSYVLDWILEHLPVFRSKSAELDALVFFEDLIREAEVVLREICPDIEGAPLKRALTILRKPSRTTRHSSEDNKNAIAKVDISGLIGGWMDCISEKEKKRMHEIFCSFDVPYYSVASPLPIRTR